MKSDNINRKGILGYLLIFFTLFLTSQSHAVVTFEKWYGNTYWDEAKFVQQTTDGGYIIIGTTHNHGNDIWIIKTDSLGDTLWTKTYGGIYDDVGHFIQHIAEDEYVVVGYTRSFGIGTPTYANVYFLKINSSGDTLWTGAYGECYEESGFSCSYTGDDAYVICGLTTSYGSGCKVYIIKVGRNANVIWTKTFGGTHVNIGYSIQQTSDDGYIVAGGTNSYGAGYMDVYLIKTDIDGNVEGVEEASYQSPINDQLSVYPNPFTHYCSVAPWESDLQGQTPMIQIYDLSGRLVGTAISNTIGSSLKPGVYFLKAKGYRPKKVVKLR